MRVYVSGPMSGYPDLNFEAFEQAEDLLNSLGFTAINPFTIGEEDTTIEEVTPKIRAQYLRADIAVLSECDGIVLIEGWRRSIGANIELHVAQLLDLAVFEMDSTEIMPRLLRVKANQQLITQHLNDLREANHAIT